MVGVSTSFSLLVETVVGESCVVGEAGLGLKGDSVDVEEVVEMEESITDVREESFVVGEVGLESKGVGADLSEKSDA